MLKVVYSNSMIELASQLADSQLRNPLTPFEQENILVQSNELARWLSLFIARQHGIASHLVFPYPSSYLWKLFQRVLPDVPQQSRFSKDVLTWRIFDMLPSLAEKKEFTVIKQYLAGEQDLAKQYGLSHRIADTYDQYLMYRPDWLLKWESGDCEHWQSMLWHELTRTEAQPANHRANLLNQLKHVLQNGDFDLSNLPSRLSLFGISALPPVYLELFAMMSQYTDITVYFLSPTDAYWGDLVDQKTKSKRLVQSDLFDVEETDAYLSVGHPLLSSMGKQGKAFFQQLQELEHESIEQYVFNEPHNLLTHLQHAIFSLEGTSGDDGKIIIPPEDKSIMVHSCHSAMREIEVLHDQVLALLEEDPSIAPTDIVVMTPNIEIYAPWIDAVFGQGTGETKIPYGIADCGSTYQSPVITAFLTLLTLPQSRFDAEMILGLLDTHVIQQQFAFEQADIELIRQWVKTTNIRWGLSPTHKGEFDLPETDSNTWQAGIDRLLLGFAMPMAHQDNQTHLFEGQLAFDNMTGEKALLAGRLSAFIDKLDTQRKKLSQRHSVHDWQGVLNELIDVFFSIGLDSQDEVELNTIRQTLAKLQETTSLAEFDAVIPLQLVKEWFNQQLDSVITMNRFMGSGVTFCGMVPMRSIPFDVVALIGMNDASYPRRDPVQGFDLLAQDTPRIGDRSRRDDDRYLFLEALLSTQKYFYISYTGASVSDNALIPPSVLVSDLKDVIEASYMDESGSSIWTQLFTQHPLQAFSRRYFDKSEPHLFSFASQQCPDIKAKETQSDHRTWFSETLPTADENWHHITLDQLLRFYKHPTRFLLRERLGMKLDLSEDEIEVREPFAMDGLGLWHLKNELLNHRMVNEASDDIQQIIKATGSLPQGEIGELIYQQADDAVSEFIERLSEKMPASFLPERLVEVQLEQHTLSGVLSNLSTQGMLFSRIAKTKGHDIVSAWLSHLILNIAQPKDIACETILVTEDATYHFLPVNNPLSWLDELVNLYWQGIHHPLPFFSQSSYAYAKTALGKSKSSPDKKMQEAWESNENNRGEDQDPHHYQVYGESSPLTEEAKSMALRIYEPILAHLAEDAL